MLAVITIALLAVFAEPGTTVVTIDGRALTTADLAFLELTRGINDAAASESRERLIDQLIERTLIRRFLERRKIEASVEAVELQLHDLEELIRRRGEDPATLYARWKLSPEAIKRELALGLAWERYVQLAVTPAQVRTYFEEHPSELDGTRVRVRQIFRKAKDDVEAQAAESLLKTVRGDLERQGMTFEVAAKQHSQSPSAAAGGDVGWIGGPGRLPAELTTAALSLQPGELAGPIRTRFGVHLIQVTAREPGQLSVEDARPIILSRLSSKLWAETVAAEKQTSRIERSRSE